MEIPSYTQDPYARRFLQGKTIFPEDTPIFHRVGCQYDYLAGLSASGSGGQAVLFDAVFSSAQTGNLSVEAISPRVLRIKLWQGQPDFADESPMLLPLPLDRPTLQVSDSAASCELATAGYRLVLEKRPFCLKVFSPSGEIIFESETELLVSLLTAPPMGFRSEAGLPGSERWGFFSWRSRNEDRYYGLGEKFTRFEKTSSRATIWQEDTCGSNTTDMSYKAVPVLFSTAGWGLMLHSSFRSYWEVGSFSYATGGAMLEDDKLDLFLMLAPSLKELIQLYTGLTGRASMIPKWAFGSWFSRAPYLTSQEMQGVAERLRAERIPSDVFNMDPSWMKKAYYDEIGVEICNFEWNDVTWPDPEKTFAWFASQGYNLCMWCNPYFSEDSAAYAEAKAKGYLAKSADGPRGAGVGESVSRLEFGLAAGIVDFTNPEAKTWWQEKLTYHLRQGISLFKVDFGDRIPETAVFYNGKTGREMHNLYVHLYAETVFETVKRFSGTGIIWRRPGYIGSQRFPVTWAGDTQVTWEGMKGALRGMLSGAMTGEVFCSHDIGGFVGQIPPVELYIRWAQFGLLSPLSRFHSFTPREPWFFGNQAVEVVRHYASLRYTLVPYLLACGRAAVDSGIPMLRAMVLEFQGEPGVDQIDDQYLLGGDLLVAPVFRSGLRSRPVYLPTGAWYPLEGGETLAGPRYHAVPAPLERLPLFARAGAVIPRYAEAPQHLKGPAPQAWLLDIYPGDSLRQMTIPETGFDLSITYRWSSERAALTRALQVSPAPITITIRLIGARRDDLPASQPWATGDGFVSMALDASAGIDLAF